MESKSSSLQIVNACYFVSPYKVTNRPQLILPLGPLSKRGVIVRLNSMANQIGITSDTDENTIGLGLNEFNVKTLKLQSCPCLLSLCQLNNSGTKLAIGHYI